MTRRILHVPCRCLAQALAWVSLAATPAAASTLMPVTITGETTATNGIFDPSVEYASIGGTGWLTYSAVYGGEVPFGPNVETRIASSADGGATWTFEQVVSASVPGQVTLPDGSVVDGFWNREVSSLVYDPTDVGHEWKIFHHTIFRRTDGAGIQPAYSWIGLRTASDPAGTWSPERRLFGSGPLPPTPFTTEVAINTLHPSLSHLLVYSEPGAFAANGTLFVSLTGLVASGSDRIVLLASDDHGDSWRFVSTLLDNSDAGDLGFLSFDGTAIVEQQGRQFLLTTPESAGVQHDGLIVFEFSDLASGSLVRDAAGAPLIVTRIPRQPGLLSPVGGGQSDYHEGNTAGGVLFSQLDLADAPALFQFHQTGAPLIAPEPATAVLLLVAALGAPWLGPRRIGGAARRTRRRPDPVR